MLATGSLLGLSGSRRGPSAGWNGIHALRGQINRVLHCSTPDCSWGTATTLYAVGDVGRFSSLTIGKDGLGLITYYDGTNGNLNAAHCSSTLCSVATTAILDSVGDVGQYSSVTMGSDGLGLVSYLDATNGQLKVAHCSNALCQPFVRNR